MADYIEREKLIDGIMDEVDPIMVKEPISGFTFSAIIDLQVATYIAKFPAADVRPVVRCADCKHWFDNGTDLCGCDMDAIIRHRDFFCANGEKRNG